MIELLPYIVIPGLVFIAWFILRRQWRSVVIADFIALATVSLVLELYGFAVIWALGAILAFSLERPRDDDRPC